MDSADDEYFNVVESFVGGLEGTIHRVDLSDTENADSVLTYEAADSPTVLLGTIEYSVVEFVVAPIEKEKEDSISFNWASRAQLSMSSYRHTLSSPIMSSYQSINLIMFTYCALLLFMLALYLWLRRKALARSRRRDESDLQQNPNLPQCELPDLCSIESTEQLELLENSVDEELRRLKKRLQRKQRHVNSNHFDSFFASDELLMAIEEILPAKKECEKSVLSLELYKVAIREKRDSAEFAKLQLMKVVTRDLERARGREFSWEDYTRLIKAHARLREANLFEWLQDDLLQEVERFQEVELEQLASRVSAQERHLLHAAEQDVLSDFEILHIQESEPALLARGGEEDVPGITNGEEGSLVAVSPRFSSAGVEYRRLLETNHLISRYWVERDRLLFQFDQAKSRASMEAEDWLRKGRATRDQHNAMHRQERHRLEEREHSLNAVHREEEENLRELWKRHTVVYLLLGTALCFSIGCGSLLLLTCARSLGDLDRFAETTIGVLSLPISFPRFLPVVSYWQGALLFSSGGWSQWMKCVALILVRCIPAEVLNQLRRCQLTPVLDAFLQGGVLALYYYFLVEPLWKGLIPHIGVSLCAMLGWTVLKYAACSFWYVRSFLLACLVQAALSAVIVYFANVQCTA